MSEFSSAGSLSASLNSRAVQLLQIGGGIEGAWLPRIARKLLRAVSIGMRILEICSCNLMPTREACIRYRYRMRENDIGHDFRGLRPVCGDSRRASRTHYLKGPFTFGCAFILSTFSLTGCASDEIKWTEEVRLHDGSIVQVKRRTELSESGFPTQQRGFPKYFELCYLPLNVHWKSRSEYRPTVFDIVNGKPFVKVPIRGCTECSLQAFPLSDALYFSWIGGEWTKVEEDEVLRGLPFNLLESFYASNNKSRDAQGLVSLIEKEQRDASIYSSMRATGRSGPGAPGACEKCRKDWGTVRTDRSSEVLLPIEKRGCDW